MAAPATNKSQDPFETSTPNHLGALTILNPDLAKVDLDIWFVHGLLGNRKSTWTHDDPPNAFWPQFIAEDIPNARVITYGYDANVVDFSRIWGGTETSGLDTYGKDLAIHVRDERKKLPGAKPRPIYFIGHSLGGLVVEQALVTCLGPDPSLQAIPIETAGVIFMGTPHSGAQLAIWGKRMRRVFETLVPPWIKNTNKEILDILGTESNVCRIVEEQFQSHAKYGTLKHLDLYCYFETMPMKGLSKVVVPKQSAVIPSEPNCSIHGTHSGIVKFENKNDPGYKHVKSQLEEYFTNWKERSGVKLADGAVSAAPSSAPAALPNRNKAPAALPNGNKVSKSAPSEKTEPVDETRAINRLQALQELQEKRTATNTPDGGRAPLALGAIIGSISGGGRHDFSVYGTEGDFFNMKNAHGHAVGKQQNYYSGRKEQEDTTELYDDTDEEKEDYEDTDDEKENEEKDAEGAVEV